MPSKPNTAAKELRTLMSTLSVIRILNYVSQTPMGSADISKRLRTTGTAIDDISLNRTLFRLRRQGWLTAKNSNWSPTLDGRKALKIAISGLKDLAHLTRDNQ
jgi:hypothetical protein